MATGQPKDVFVSYHMDSSEDVVQKICESLEKRGISCWYASRDSQNAYADTIVDAIEECKLFLLILNENSNISEHIKNEINVAANYANKHKEVVLLPFRIDNCEMSKGVYYYLGRMRFMDGTMPPEEQRIKELTDRITELLGKQSSRITTIPGNTFYGRPDDKSYQIISSMMYPDNQFVGRKRELDEIHTYLTSIVNKTFLVGMGGIGKSEIAKMYCKLHADDYDVIVWVSFTGSLLETFCSDSLFPIKGISRSDYSGMDDFSYFKTKLQILKTITDSKILFVIDNFDVTEDPYLKEFCSGPYSVLFTTRYKQEEKSIPEVIISAFESEQELLTLFQSEYTRLMDDSALQIVKQIIQLLSGHTLSIRLVASTMQKQRIKPEKMLSLLQQGISVTAEQNVKGSHFILEHLRQVFNISILSEEELYILKNLSLLPLQGISVELFYEWCDLEDYDIIEELIRRNWVIHNRATDEVHLHPMIGDLFTEEVAKDPQCCNTLLQHFVSANKNLFSTKVEFKIFLLDCANSMLHRLPAGHPLLIEVQKVKANRLFGLSYYHESISYFLDLLHLDLNLEDKAWAYSKLGHLYGLLKKGEESLEVSLKGWDLIKDIPVHSLSDNLGYTWKQLVGRIGEAYRILGDYDKALEFQELALAHYDHHYSTTPQSTKGWCLFHCASTRLERNSPGDFETAHAMILEGIAAFEEVNDNWAKSFSYDILAQILSQLGEFENALTYNQKALDILLPLLGNTHLDIAKNITVRGHVYRTKGDVASANECYRKAAAIYHSNGADIYENEVLSLIQ